MIRYGLLLLPSANRVYSEAAVRLTVAEIELFSRTVLSCPISGIEPIAIAGVHYVQFSAERLSAQDLRLLANLSSAFALFELEGELLRPVELLRLEHYDDDLLTIQKYSGKTNEQFTKLLLNATLLSSAFAGEFLTRRFQVLDPLCGRGTTLNQALMYGYDAAGIDLDLKDFEAYSTFMSTWLKRKRLKHHFESGPIRRNRQLVARRMQVTTAPAKESYRAGDVQHLDVLNADTTQAREFFGASSFDVIVTDAPYGVQHGSRTAERAMARSPLDLLADAVPVWTTMLRPGGALGIAWNTFVASREDVAKTLTAAGLEPLEDGPYLEFKHRVDQSILRDIIVARRP